MSEIKDSDIYLVLHEDDYEPYWDGFSSLKEAEEEIVLDVACGNRPPVLVKVERWRTARLHKIGKKECEKRHKNRKLA